MESQRESARVVVCNSMEENEESSLKGHFAAWRRWLGLVRQFLSESADATDPSLEATND